MRHSSALMAMAAFAHSTLAQLAPQDGFTTTSYFLPFATDGSYITALGSGNGSTTWGMASSAAGLATPYLNVTLGPVNMHYTLVNNANQVTMDGIVFSTVSTIQNCSYTSLTPTTTTSANVTAVTMTALCKETVIFQNSNRATLKYRNTDLPVANATASLVGLPAGFDGYVDVYVGTSTDGAVSTATLSTSTRPGAAAEVTAWVNAAVVMAVGAAALAV